MVRPLAFTENGAASLATVQPPDLAESVEGRMGFFFKVVRSLLTDTAQLHRFLAQADAESVRDTLILVLHLRNCRQKNGGKGERDLFRRCVEWYNAQHRGHLWTPNLALVAKFGRWDDLLFCEGGPAFLARQLLQDYRTTMAKKSGSSEPKDAGAAQPENTGAVHPENTGAAHPENTGAAQPSLSLAAKWTPSPSTNNKKSKNRFVPVLKALNEVLAAERRAGRDEPVQGLRQLNERAFRQMLSLLRRELNITETQMCSGRWDDIDFNKTPSYALRKYGKTTVKVASKRRRSAFESEPEPQPGAFLRHCPERYTAWKTSLKEGKTADGTAVKINAGVLFPHEVVAQYTAAFKAGRFQPDDVLEAQWRELERNVKSQGTLGGCLFVADVSGSMDWPVTEHSSLRCMDVSVALSLLSARCSTGAFRDLVMTFSEAPTFFNVATGQYSSGTAALPASEVRNDPGLDPTSLFAAIQRLQHMNWGGSTNLQSVFDMILERATHDRVPPEAMPRCVVVVSDMEFDACGALDTNFETLRAKYAASAYVMPTLVFWNVRSSSTTHQVPVNATEDGTLLFSGFSPSLLKELMSEGFANINPWKMVRKIIDSGVYAGVVVAAS